MSEVTDQVGNVLEQHGPWTRLELALSLLDDLLEDRGFVDSASGELLNAVRFALEAIDEAQAASPHRFLAP